MTEVARAEVAKALARAQDALQKCIQVARKNNLPDLAKSLNEQCKQLGAKITNVNGGPVKLSKTELLGTFRP